MMPKNNTPYRDYSIKLKNKALKQIEKLPLKTRIAILEKLDALKDNIECLNIKKLEGYPTYYRIRCGDYRIVYRPFSDSKKIYVILVAHRKEVYMLLELLDSNIFD